jgi:primosomal protein N' (replication factor Y)
MKTEVLLPKVFNFSFTYNSGNIPLKLGDFVEIPFGQRKEIGVVWKSKKIDLKKNIKIKNISNKIYGYSIDKKLINFVEWFATYNMVPLGLVLKMVVGNKDNIIKKIKENSKKIITEKKKYKLNFEQSNALEYLNLVNNKFDVSVLQGTTGSGKTLVYFKRIKKLLMKINKH